MKACFICSIIMALSFTARPCANFSGSGTKFNGTWTSDSQASGVMELRRALTRDLTRDGAEMETSLRGATNFNDRSDYSVALMYLGRNKEAVELLQKLEAEEPGHYFV